LTARLVGELDLRSWGQAAADGDEDAIAGLANLNGIGRFAREELENACGQAADRGDLATMDRIRGLLLFALADLPNRGISLATQAREEERWYRRAAEAGSGPAIVRLSQLLDRLDRHEEAMEWLRRGSQAGHPAVMVRLAEAETSADHLDEAERLLRSARDLEDTEAAVPLAALLQSRGRYAGAEQVLLDELADGHEPESIMLLLAEYQQSPAGTERWLRAAVAEGSMRAQVRLGTFLSVHRQYAEAQELLQSAIDAGWIAARRPLADNFALQGRIAEADREYEWAAVERTTVGGLPTDWGTVVTTAVVTAAAVPFVKTLAQKAAEDSYAAVRKFIRHLIRTHGQRKREYGATAHKGPVLLVHDPNTGTILRLPPDLPDDAIRALIDATLTTPSDTVRPVRLIWDPTKGQWTQITGPESQT